MRIGISRISLIIIFAFLLTLYCHNRAFTQEANQLSDRQESNAEGGAAQGRGVKPQYLGEFFDVKVSRENYFFIKSTLMVFGCRGVSLPTIPEEAEKIIWRELLLSYEAFRRGITVEQQEVDEEIRKMLLAEKVTFDWKKDKDAYESWIKAKANEPIELFENQIRHLLQIQKLNEQVVASIEPDISEKEAYQEFLNEHNTLGVELIEFSTENEARKFYLEVKKNTGKWDALKAQRPGDFKRIGSVALEFLIDIWRFPKTAVYAMMNLEPGSIHPPVHIYNGYAVLKVLDKRPADKSQYKRLRDSYYEQVRRRMKYEGLGRWLEDLKRQANIKIYDVAGRQEEKNE